MKRKVNIFIFCFILFLNLLSNSLHSSVLDDYKFTGSTPSVKNAIITKIQFNGYTNYWHDIYRQWIHYGNLFKIDIPDVASTIAQSKTDIAKELRVPGLTMEEGFLNYLLKKPYVTLYQPSLPKLEEFLAKGNVLLFVDAASKLGQKVLAKLPEDDRNKKLNNLYYRSGEIDKTNCYYLSNGDRKLFIVSSNLTESLKRIQQLIERTEIVLKEYDLHRGWFGVETNLKSVTCMHGHPLEIIGRGMREGNTWFTFSGYNDFMMKDELTNWLASVKNPVVADVGVTEGVGVESIYGCKDYEGLQVQDMGSKEAWIKFARQKGGYIFRPVYDPASDPYHYDGYIIKNTGFGLNDGNKEQIDNENVPFVYITGSLQSGAVPCMVLFIKKGETLSKELMWKAILGRREVAVLGQGEMMGPEYYRNVLQMLLLDRIFLEEYFGDRVDIQAAMENYDLVVTLKNFYNHSLSGKLKITLPPQLKLVGKLFSNVILPAQSTKEIRFKIWPKPEAMHKTNPILVHYEWDNNRQKSTLTMLDMPPAISVHKLLYGYAPEVIYPVTIHNFTPSFSVPVHLKVFSQKDPNKVIYKATRNCSIAPSTFKNLSFRLKVPPGDYKVKVAALGLENTTQLGVGKPEGKPFVYKVDLNGDGIDEYRMENDSVRVTLLAIGGRVIEYIVKSRKDNIFFKLWPKKPVDDRRAFRKRAYYPYGGFEDFLGQPSIETHRVYHTEILKKEGNYVRVRMSANYYGNKLEKIFTLYGNSPLLEIRFALTFKNPELNMLGPQPMLELGKVHGTEDVFIVPTVKGLQRFRMRPEEYWGRILHLQEGWNAGYDTKQDIAFVGAFPVTQPLFLHMWMNHPKNPGSHYYYAEFQPWVPIFQKSTMYFSYYIWGSGGSWQKGLNALKSMNLITKR